MKIQFKQWMHPQMGVVPVDPKTPLVLEAEIEREWVGLTGDEKEKISYKAEGNTWTAVELTEAKLKEKNT
jgi:hypothetical protein